MLTDKAVKAAKPLEGKRYRKLADQGGMYLFLTTDGTRSWRFDYRLAGQRKTATLGLYPEVSLAEARERHAEARRQVQQGQCPVLLKRRARAAAALGAVNTVRAMAEAWFAELMPHKSESWREGIRGWLDRYIYPALGNRPVAEVEPLEILELVKGIATEFPHTAEGVRQTLARIFQFAIRNLRCKQNPAREVQGAVIVPPPEHHKPIPAKDIPGFIEKLEAYSGRTQTKLAAKLLLLTMVRKSELIHATWDEIDLEAGIWTIPPERMKRRVGHIVPLSRQALETFKALKPLAFRSKYVFPSNGDSHNKPMSKATLNHAFRDAGVDVRPHGLRATASTVLNESNQFRPDVIERQLSHLERNAIRGAYNRAEYMDERRAMLQWWADFVYASPRPKAAIARLEGRRKRA